MLSPFYIQLVVDEVIVKQDVNLLLVLFIGYGMLHAINLITHTLRSYILLSLSNLFGYQIVTNLFRHLIRLPMDFFEKRHIGDILSRFESTEPIRKILTEDLIEAVIDGFMAVTTLIMMYLYSPLLSLIVLVSVSCYMLVSFLLLSVYRNRVQDEILSQSNETSTFIESIRSMQSIKLFSKENDRENIWQNRYSEVINSAFRVGKINITLEFFKTFFTSTETIIVIYVAATLVLKAEFTVGMIFAFIAYKSGFVEKVLSLVEKMMDLRMIKLHLQRLADIVHTEMEEDAILDYSMPTPDLKGNITIDNLSFRYSSDESYIFKNLDLSIKAGKIFAITGESGCGKTTLLKLLVGLFKPTQGSITVDNQTLHKNLNMNSFRSNISVVMQDDQLLSGTISDNICFFDSQPDFQLINECAKAASIDSDIEQMPMQYMTLVGDMGNFLSGGQKQRILLARALYKKPKILFIDEGTSHLDVATEIKVNRNIKRLNITRVIIAHRPETINQADYIFNLPSNTLVENRLDSVG